MKIHKIVNLISFLGVLGFGLQSKALPIFSENRAMKLASGVVLYPDSENPNLVYYFPGQGELARENRSSSVPLFGFTYWGLRKSPTDGSIVYNADAGGYLSLAAHLTFTPEQLAEVKAILGENGQVAVLPVTESTIDLTTTASSNLALGKFFDEFNIARRGGQADAMLSINASLTGLGARTMMTAIKNPMFMKFDYCYHVQGLSPLFKGVVKLNWSQVYERLKTSFSTGGWFFRKNVSVTIQKLIREGALQIEINAAPESEAKYEEFIMKMANMLMERMFKTELPEIQGRSGSGWSFARIGLDYGRSEVSEKITISLTRRELVTHEQCIPVNIAGLKDHFDEVVQSSDGISVNH